MSQPDTHHRAPTDDRFTREQRMKSETAWAHVRLDPSTGGAIPHLLTDHLGEVARRAGDNAASFGREWAYLAGLWHDVGKQRAGIEPRSNSKSTLASSSAGCSIRSPAGGSSISKSRAEYFSPLQSAAAVNGLQHHQFARGMDPVVHASMGLAAWEASALAACLQTRVVRCVAYRLIS